MKITVQSSVLAVLGFCLILLVLKVSFPYLAPFFLGLFLALLLDVPISYLEGRGWSRAFTSLVLVSTTFLGLPIFLTIFLFKLWQEVQELLGSASFGEWSSMFSEQAIRFFEDLPLTSAQFTPANLIGLTETLFRWTIAIPDLLLIWTLAAFSAYFFCRDKKVLTKFVTQQLPRHRRFGFFRVYHDTSGALWHLTKVQLLLMLMSTSLSMLFFCLLQLPYALLMGFLVGFFDLMPVLGPGLVYLSLSIIQLWLGNPSLAIALGVGYLILLLLRQWGEPHLISDRLGLHPLMALLGLYVGFRFWGLLGALLGPILMVFLKAFIGTYSNT